VNSTQLAALERDWWKNLVSRVFVQWGHFERFDDYFSELFEYFAEAAAWTLYPEVPATLAALKERGLILDVISNFDSRLHRILAGLGIADCFDEVFISSAVGHAKPDPRIFQAALQKHGFDPTDVAHIGDSETNDIRGASNLGLKAILVNRGGPQPSPSLPCVGSLNEIFPLLFA
jgi:putative hydrolase of the HAD superfamily